MKVGFKTSEFWVTIGIGLLKAFVPSIPDELIALGGAYVVSRGVAKAGKTSPADVAQATKDAKDTPPTR